MGPIKIIRYQGLQMVAEHFDAEALWFRNHILSLPGLVIGTTSAAAVKIANTTNYLSAGFGKSKATAEIAFTAGAASNIANGQEQVFMLQLDGSGNGLLIPSQYGPTTGAGTCPLPELPSDGLTCIGYCRIFCGGASTFTAATTLLSATGLTVTYYDGAAFPQSGLTVAGGSGNTLGPGIS